MNEKYTHFFGAFPFVSKAPRTLPDTEYMKHLPLIALVVDVYALPKSIAIQPIFLCSTTLQNPAAALLNDQGAQLSPTEVRYQFEHIRQDRAPNLMASYATCNEY